MEEHLLNPFTLDSGIEIPILPPVIAGTGTGGTGDNIRVHDPPALPAHDLPAHDFPVHDLPAYDPPAQDPPVTEARSRRRKPVSWETRLEELKFFKRLKGSCRVPWGYEANPSLASWCDNQRRQRKLKYEGKTSSLTDERESALTELGFWWGYSCGVRVKSFEERMSDLEKWKKRHGAKIEGPITVRLLCSNALGCKDESLAQWLRYQTERFQSGLLCPEREALLRECGVELIKKDPPEARLNWEEGYRKLIEYKERFGTTNVVEEEGGAGELEKWVNIQRKRFQSRCSMEGNGHSEFPNGRKKTAMSDEHLAALQEIGFCFQTWDVMYEDLLRWQKRHPGESAPKDHVTQLSKIPDDCPDRELRGWLYLQRTNFRKWRAGKLDHNPTLMSDRRLIKLLKAGFEFDPPPCRPKKKCID
mmetsp:Transcript_30454/g.69729  ORF Transcript_30454/g.69729 Transcript_30454/m.69729 type:complete len:418 (-) Transcript_30454:1043-2296(-)